MHVPACLRNRLLVKEEAGGCVAGGASGEDGLLQGQWRPEGGEAADDIAVDARPRQPLRCSGPSSGTDRGPGRGQCTAHMWPRGLADVTDHSEETGRAGVLGSA